MLSDRVRRIGTLLDASFVIPKSERVAVNKLWLEAKELAKWRNRIAHNPVTPTWKAGSGSDPAKDPPDLLGIPVSVS